MKARSAWMMMLATLLGTGALVGTGNLGCDSSDSNSTPPGAGGGSDLDPYINSQVCASDGVYCNEGVTPPSVAGTYCGTAKVRSSTSGLWKDGSTFEVKLTLANQSAENWIDSTIDLGTFGTLGNNGAWIRGEDIWFSVYMESDWTPEQNCSYHTLAVLTGVADKSQSPSSLKGELKWAFTQVPEGCSAEVNSGAFVDYEVKRDCGTGGSGGDAGCSCDTTADSCDPGCACDPRCADSGTAGEAGSPEDAEAGAPECGNGVREGTEACDKTDFGDTTCDDFGFVDGKLTCTDSCTVESTNCTYSGRFVNGLGDAHSLVVDSDHLYWVEIGSAGRKLVSIPKKKGGTAKLLTNTKIQNNLFEPYGKLIALSDSKIYWAESNNGVGSLKAIPLAGGSVETIVSSTEAVAPGWEPTGAIALVGNRIFLSEYTFYKTQKGRILAVDLATNTPTVFASTADENTQLGHLASDGTALFWTERRFSAFKIMREPVAGGSASPICTDEARDLIIRGSYLYYKATDAENNLRRVALTGGASTALVSTGSSDVSGLDVDATHAYWLLGVKLSRVGLEGGTAETVAKCPLSSGDLLVDGDIVYYSCSDSIYRYKKH